MWIMRNMGRGVEKDRGNGKDYMEASHVEHSQTYSFSQKNMKPPSPFFLSTKLLGVSNDATVLIIS